MLKSFGLIVQCNAFEAIFNINFKCMAPSNLQELIQLIKAAKCMSHTKLEQQDFDSCLCHMQSQCKQFLAKISQAMEQMVVLSKLFIGASILVHACSKVVMYAAGEKRGGVWRQHH